MNSIILFAIIGLIIIIAGYFIYKMSTNNSSDDELIKKALASGNNSSDDELIKKALASGNITTLNTSEHFEDIVFDSIDKIKNNFETFINRYFSYLDVKLMNNMLKNDYGIDKSIQEIISNIPNIKMSAYTDLIIQNIGFILNSNLSEENLILSGLGITVISNIVDKTNKAYYLNDYKKVNDFVIYFVSKDYNTNLITATNTDIKDFYTPNGEQSNTSVPYKVSINNLKKYFLTVIIQAISGMLDNNIKPTQDEINNLGNIIKANINAFIEFSRLLLIGPLIFYKKPNDTQIINDIKKVLTDKINNEMKTYMPPLDDIESNYKAAFKYITGV